jgi:integrase
VLRPALKKLDLPMTRAFDLRHTCASLTLAARRSVHEVAAQLGHGADMTLKVYGHLIEEHRGQPAIDLAARVRAVRER